MKLKDLPVGSKFLIIREGDKRAIYRKIRNWGRFVLADSIHTLVPYEQQVLIHGSTLVEEIK